MLDPGRARVAGRSGDHDAGVTGRTVRPQVLTRRGRRRYRPFTMRLAMFAFAYRYRPFLAEEAGHRRMR